MEIPKLPPASVETAGGASRSGHRASAPPSGGPPPGGTPADAVGRGVQAPSATAVSAAMPGIRPLETAAALNILLTEIRLALLESAGVSAQSEPVYEGRDAIALTARAIVESLLQTVAVADPPAQSLAGVVDGLRLAVETAGGNAIDRVSAWPGTPPSVVESLQQAHSLALAVIGDPPPAGTLIRPEWSGMAPRIAQLRRRIRRRPRLTDADADRFVDEPGADRDERER